MADDQAGVPTSAGDPLDRWTAYGGPAPHAAAGWSFELLTPPAPLWGSNGIVSDRGRLLVTQVFGSQVTAIDVSAGPGRGRHSMFSPLGGGIAGPDDGVFTADGTFFATEPMNATVSALDPDGGYRKLSTELPGINGITTDRAGRRLFADEMRPGGRLWELDPAGERAPRLLLDELMTPNALAAGPDGGLWFPLVAPGEIWRYDLETGTAECRVRDLAACCAVKFDDEGRLLAAESAAGRVTAIDIASGARRTVAETQAGIDNLAVAPDGRLFVSHFVDGWVVEVDPAGTITATLSPPGLIGPLGVARLGDGAVLVADGLSVATLTADGTVRRIHALIRGLPTPAVGAATLDGEPVVLGERGQVLACPADQPLRQVAGRLRDVSGLAPSGDGGLLVTERGPGRVLRVDGSGVTGEVATGLSRPAAAVGDSEGTVWVVGGEGLLGLRNGEVSRRVAALAGATGVAVGPAGVLVAHPPSRRLVLVDPADGDQRELVVDAPIGSPVVDTLLPYTVAAVAADGDGFLVGCIGDGSVRRLSPGQRRG